MQAESNQKIADMVNSLEEGKQNRSLAIWGWMPGVYVLTGIPPATRDAIGHFVITHGPYESYFRHRFVSDLRASKPDLFVDAIADGTQSWWSTGSDGKQLWWSTEGGHEIVSELGQYIAANYVLVAKLSLIPGEQPVRFYRRRE